MAREWRCHASRPSARNHPPRNPHPPTHASYATYYLTRNSLTYTAPVMVADPALRMDITQARRQCVGRGARARACAPARPPVAAPELLPPPSHKHPPHTHARRLGQ